MAELPDIATLRTQHDAAILRLRTRAAEAATASYDAIERPRDRRIATIAQTGPEASSLPPRSRLQSIAESRQLIENDLTASGLFNTIQTNVVGPTGGKPVFHTPDKNWNAAAAALIATWAKDCDYRIPGLNLNEWLKIALASFLGDGDFLLVHDPDLTGNKLLTYEADQICDLRKADFAATNWGRQGHTQVSGVIADRTGRVAAYIGSAKRGQISTTASAATIYPADVARLIYRPRRFSQYRGASVLLPMITVLSDFRALIESEIKTAKRIATEALFIEQENPTAGLFGNLTPEQLAAGTTSDPTALAAPTSRYEELEDAYGGAVTYGKKGEKINVLANNRPALGIKDFELHAKQSCGLSLGLYKMFSTGEVTTSYSAARAELILTHAIFASLQKFLERQILDHTYPRLLNSAIAAGTLPPAPAGVAVASSYTVQWPAMPILDALDEIEAFYRRIRYGQTNFDLELGPEREAIHTRLAENMQFLRESGLENLPYFATASGAPVTTEPAPAKKRG